MILIIVHKLSVAGSKFSFKKFAFSFAFCKERTKSHSAVLFPHVSSQTRARCETRSAAVRTGQTLARVTLANVEEQVAPVLEATRAQVAKIR